MEMRNFPILLPYLYHKSPTIRPTLQQMTTCLSTIEFIKTQVWNISSRFEITFHKIIIIFVKAVLETGCSELSPPQVLFILEFQIHVTENQFNLVYVPHRFFHRYSRNPEAEDRSASERRFIREIGNGSVYFNHIEVGKSHAFAAIKEGNGISTIWII